MSKSSRLMKAVNTLLTAILLSAALAAVHAGAADRGWQAQAGIDPGAGHDSHLHRAAERLLRRAGHPGGDRAGEEPSGARRLHPDGPGGRRIDRSAERRPAEQGCGQGQGRLHRAAAVPRCAAVPDPGQPAERDRGAGRREGRAHRHQQQHDHRVSDRSHAGGRGPAAGRDRQDRGRRHYRALRAVDERQHPGGRAPRPARPGRDRGRRQSGGGRLEVRGPLAVGARLHGGRAEGQAGYDQEVPRRLGAGRHRAERQSREVPQRPDRAGPRARGDPGQLPDAAVPRPRRAQRSGGRRRGRVAQGKGLGGPRFGVCGYGGYVVSAEVRNVDVRIGGM